MSDQKEQINQEIQDLYNKKAEQDSKVIQEMIAKIKQVFPIEQQSDFIIDMFTQVFSNSTDIDELNQGYIMMSCYIDAFYVALVTNHKIISEEEFKELSQAAYQQSLEQIQQATQDVWKDLGEQKQ